MQLGVGQELTIPSPEGASDVRIAQSEEETSFIRPRGVKRFEAWSAERTRVGASEGIQSLQSNNLRHNVEVNLRFLILPFAQLVNRWVGSS